MFTDEIREFKRKTLEVLRESLEDGELTIEKKDMQRAPGRTLAVDCECHP